MYIILFIIIFALCDIKIKERRGGYSPKGEINIPKKVPNLQSSIIKK